jgi:hypothetical protein
MVCSAELLYCVCVCVCVLNEIIETVRTTRETDTFLEGKTMDEVH